MSVSYAARVLQMYCVAGIPSSPSARRLPTTGLPPARLPVTADEALAADTATCSHDNPWILLLRHTDYVWSCNIGVHACHPCFCPWNSCCTCDLITVSAYLHKQQVISSLLVPQTKLTVSLHLHYVNALCDWRC